MKKDTAIKKLSTTILNGITLAMGIAVIVLNILGEISTESSITMLAIAVTCVGILTISK